ncbi:MAG: disulfide bond formation protein B, partial [Rhizomicrobium sp.]
MAVGTGAFLLLLGALGFQYIGGIAPCEMCQWQRWAHIGAALAGIVGGSLATREPTMRSLAWIAILFVVVYCSIGAY